MWWTSFALAQELSPLQRLDARLPGLSDVIAAWEVDPAPMVPIIEAADGALLDRLLPVNSPGPRFDIRGEDSSIDLDSAEVALQGTVLAGYVCGAGAVNYGVWLHLDTQGGPAPDLQVGVGPGWILTAPMDGWRVLPGAMHAGHTELQDPCIIFEVDLADTGRIDPAHTGAVTVTLAANGAPDAGPAGAIGQPEPHALAVLTQLATVDTAAADPDLTVAVALSFGALRAVVAPELWPVVEDDARAWLAYGAEVDSWLAAQGAGWRLRELSPLGKLMWAWPAAQGVVYGALPISSAQDPLNLARYRFLVPTVDQLRSLRDELPLVPDARDTALLRETQVWKHLRYRGTPELMEAMCARKELSKAECAAWDAEKGTTLGEVDGVPIALHEGVSVDLQLGLDPFVGDCSTATTLALAAWQAVGLAGLPVGYAGADGLGPVHNQPLLLEGERFFSTQHAPDAHWDTTRAYVYAILPGLHPSFSWALGAEPGGLARGGSVAGGYMNYGRFSKWIRNGIPADTVWRWLDQAWGGHWPEMQ